MDPEDAGEMAAELHGQTVGGWGLFQIAAGAGLTAYVVWAGILMPGFRKVPLRLQVPYVPASAKQVENVMSLLKGRSGKMVDLGSGDGRIVLEAYNQGLSPAVGYELNPWLLRLSSYCAWKAGLYGKVSFHREDLWKMLPLESKLLMELPDEARVVTGRFPLPTWTPSSVAGEGVNQAWAYDIRTVRQTQKDKTEGSPV
ncbi:adenine nucleotide translocase lysine N-methyltransferase isoform X2 [Varanus komodoensis]|uniref:Adenine nucleotide translocase lysine methyltransferase n=1 Tax=Varanus komodoensis TaxID=61221 RepID=A0A8D2L4I3_VARKO|nr:adenine nucleotide translocase lysine N-methyltransferase isoform X2 [Varanus komodoensis]